MNISKTKRIFISFGVAILLLFATWYLCIIHSEYDRFIYFSAEAALMSWTHFPTDFEYKDDNVLIRMQNENILVAKKKLGFWIKDSITGYSDATFSEICILNTNNDIYIYGYIRQDQLEHVKIQRFDMETIGKVFEKKVTTNDEDGLNTILFCIKAAPSDFILPARLVLLDQTDTIISDNIWRLKSFTSQLKGNQIWCENSNQNLQKLDSLFWGAYNKALKVPQKMEHDETNNSYEKSIFCTSLTQYYFSKNSKGEIAITTYRENIQLYLNKSNFRMSRKITNTPNTVKYFDERSGANSEEMISLYDYL